MSIRKEPSGRRSIQVEVEVPGTPEEVWNAIATGPGISAWFVPTDFEVGPDGVPTRVVSHMGPGMDSVADVTEWQPPHRFSAVGSDNNPEWPSMATEWIVEARSGGVCVVRVVHSLFASTDEWDSQLEGTESGWPVFFLILKHYLTRFNARKSATFATMTFVPAPQGTAWARLLEPLGLEAATPGMPWRSPAGTPPASGTVQLVRNDDHPHVLAEIVEPVPGVVVASGCPMGDQVMLALNFYFYGDEAAGVATREEPRWQEWMKENVAVSDPSPSS